MQGPQEKGLARDLPYSKPAPRWGLVIISLCSEYEKGGSVFGDVKAEEGGEPDD